MPIHSVSFFRFPPGFIFVIVVKGTPLPDIFTSSVLEVLLRGLAFLVLGKRRAEKVAVMPSSLRTGHRIPNPSQIWVCGPFEVAMKRRSL